MSPVISKNVNEGHVGSGPGDMVVTRGYGGYQESNPWICRLTNFLLPGLGQFIFLIRWGMLTDDYVMKFNTGGSTEVAYAQ